MQEEPAKKKLSDLQYCAMLENITFLCYFVIRMRMLFFDKKRSVFYGKRFIERQEIPYLRRIGEIL